MTDEVGSESADDSSPQAESQLADFWATARTYLGNDERADAGPREDLADAAATLFGLPSRETVYVSKLTTGGLRNQVWQGLAVSRANDLMVLVDKTGRAPESVDSAVRDRLSPLAENGFNAVVVAEPTDEGWKVKAVVEYEHASLGEGIAGRIEGVEIRRIPDPAASRPVDAGVRVDGATGSRLLAHAKEAQNLVLAGPPGTGKTRAALQLVDELVAGNRELCRLESILSGRKLDDVPLAEIQAPPLVWEIIQLHPSYTYEDFVRGLRTDPNSTGFSLVSVDGILPIICQASAARRGKPTLLIIDELNRCNLPAVFGETIFAIDPAQRGRAVRLQYEGSGSSGDTLRVPPELIVVATMNTADRSIASLDFAIRRRFRFMFLGPSEVELETYYGKGSARADAAVTLLRAINALVPDPEIQVGHSYLIVKASDVALWRNQVVEKIVYEVCPLLREYEAEHRLNGPGTIELQGRAIDLTGDGDDNLIEQLGLALSLMVSDDQG